MIDNVLAHLRRLRGRSGSSLGARDWVDLLADPGSFHRLSEESGRASVLTGVARIGGQPCVLVISDFEVQAGTLGVVEGELVAAAFDHATERQRPVLAVCASGGVRQQEGAVGFLQMVKAADAVNRHRHAGLLYVSYLSQPTTGGVFASYGSLSQITWAAPGALIGFTGPKVVEALTGHEELRGVQVSENLLRHGLLDDIFPAKQLRDRMATLLRGLGRPEATAPPPAVEAVEPIRDVSAWESVERSRDPRRPSTRELLRHSLTDATYLRGDRAGGQDDPAAFALLGRFRGVRILAIGNDRGLGVEVTRVGASGLRKFRRALRLATQLGLPVVALIDTPGAETTAEAEESGLAFGIANTIATLLEVPGPTVSVLVGQGTGGGALALLPADRVLAARHAWLSPIAPEGASVIVHGTVERAAEMAEAQGIAAPRLRDRGIVDEVVEEGSDGGSERLVENLSDAILRALVELVGEEPVARVERRRARYRRIGDIAGVD